MIKLSEIRRQEGITQKQLAADLNVSSGNLCDWDKGRTEPDIERLIKIADSPVARDTTPLRRHSSL